MATITQTREILGEPPLVLRLSPVVNLTDDQFLQFCSLNGDLRIERTARGDLIVMSPSGYSSGRRNAELIGQLRDWAEKDATGEVLDSSTGFTLPNGAVRAPDASWIPKTRLAQLTPEQLEKFAPLCPPFVVELRSATDRLGDVKQKMQEYMENGAQLGWLIDPYSRRVHVYRAGVPVEEIDNPKTLAADPLLAGFTLNLGKIW